MIVKSLNSSEGRYPAVDILRGIAILTMLMANAASGTLAAPHPFIVRIYGSFAAPLFIFLAGFMVALGANKHVFSYFVRRAILILAMGALIDISLWSVLPFTTFDVLYVIGIGIPLVVLLHRLQLSLQIAICVSIIVLGPILQYSLGYSSEISGFANSEFLVHFRWENFPRWLKNLTVDGWFPLFPWLGILFAGYILASHGSFLVEKEKRTLLLGGLLFIVGISWLYLNPPIERMGYSELFYPPGVSYLCAASGSIMLGIGALRYLKPMWGMQALQWLGSCSLFIYFFHLLIIDKVLHNHFTQLNLTSFLVLYVIFVSINLLVAFLIMKLKRKDFWRKLPADLRFLLGG